MSGCNNGVCCCFSVESYTYSVASGLFVQDDGGYVQTFTPQIASYSVLPSSDLYSYIIVRPWFTSTSTRPDLNKYVII